MPLSFINYCANNIEHCQEDLCIWYGTMPIYLPTLGTPTHVSKSQHGGKVPTCEPQVTTKIWLIITKFKS